MAILGFRPSQAALLREWREANRLRGLLEKGFARRVFTEIRRVGIAAAKAFPVDGQVGLDLALEDHGAKLRAIFYPVYRRTFKIFGDRVLASAKGIKPPEVKDTESSFSASIEQYINLVGAERVRLVDATTKRQIASAIADGIAEGENLQQIAKRIRGNTSGKIVRLRSAVIARTEIHSASNVAEAEMIAASGLESQLQRRWIAVEDDRTRSTHIAADGQIRPADEPFDVGGAKLMFPGDPTGPAQEIIMCRCAVGYVTPAP